MVRILQRSCKDINKDPCKCPKLAKVIQDPQAGCKLERKPVFRLALQLNCNFILFFYFLFITLLYTVKKHQVLITKL